MSFENKVILITGAASGIGSGTAISLAKLGGLISLVDLSSAGLDETAKIIEDSGGSKPLKVLADVTIDAKRIIDETVAHFGKLDVLVNCAGILRYDGITNSNIDVFDQVMEVNLKGTAILTHLAVPHLEKTKGNVMKISSVAGLLAANGYLSYCISKAALNQFTKCCALDLASKGIRVNAVNPAMVRTPLYEASGLQMEQAEELIENLSRIHPIGRCGEVKDITNAIEYLASEKASFITGTLMVLDGGISMTNVSETSNKL